MPFTHLTNIIFTRGQRTGTKMPVTPLRRNFHSGEKRNKQESEDRRSKKKKTKLDQTKNNNLLLDTSLEVPSGRDG